MKKTLTLIILLLLGCALLSSSILAVKTFTVQETDELDLMPEAIDPDGDQVVYYFPPPFDDEGVWETGFEDAGEYLIDITASDGQEQDVETVKIIVTNKNQAPTFSESSITVQEGDLVDLTEYIVDPDEDILDFDFEGPFDQGGQWQTTFDDAGRYVIDVVADDGEIIVEDRFEVLVENVNQAPVIEGLFSEDDEYVIYLSEGDLFSFDIDVVDYDGDVLSIIWDIGGILVGDGEASIVELGYDSAGEHILTVRISDGQEEVVKEWRLIIADTNRAPSVGDQELTVYETEVVRVVDLPSTDIDGDALSYSFEAPLTSEGDWTTNYENAGSYTVLGTVSDGELSSTFEISIEVIDVDRAPEIYGTERIELAESQELLWGLHASDPDGDEVSFELSGLPDDAVFDDKDNTVSWVPSYDHVVRSENFFSNFLNAIRVENFLFGKEKAVVEIRACGKELCSSREVELVVSNTNRAPSVTEVYNQEINENEEITLFVEGSDPDGDVLRYTFSEPLGLRTGYWQTSYEDAGEHVVYVTASDGFASSTEEVIITVNNINRLPSISVPDEKIQVNEGEAFSFTVEAFDPDGDYLEIVANNLPVGASFVDNVFSWQASYDTVENRSTSFWNGLVSHTPYTNKKLSQDMATEWIEFSVSDGEFSAVVPVEIQVKNVNRLPVIHEALPSNGAVLNAQVQGDALIFSVEADDLDHDELTYTWSFGGGFDLTKVKGEDATSISRVFSTAGEKTVKVKVSDGRNSAKYKWTIDADGNGGYTVVTTQPVVTPAPFTYRIFTIENWK